MNARNASLLLGSFLVLSALNAQANGIVRFDNLGAAPERRIYRGEWVWENDRAVFISWTACTGAVYRAALYWGPAGITHDTGMIQVGNSAFFVTGSGAGWFLGGSRTITTPEAGPVLSFQVRAWEVGLANAQTWDQAIQTHGIAGKGPIFELQTKDPANVLEVPPTIGQAAGFRGFIFGADGVTAILVPEPSTIALCSIGLAALSLFRTTRIRK